MDTFSNVQRFQWKLDCHYEVSTLFIGVYFDSYSHRIYSAAIISNHNPATIYLFKVNNTNSRKRCEKGLKLTIKTISLVSNQTKHSETKENKSSQSQKQAYKYGDIHWLWSLQWNNQHKAYISNAGLWLELAAWRSDNKRIEKRFQSIVKISMRSWKQWLHFLKKI